MHLLNFAESKAEVGIRVIMKITPLTESGKERKERRTEAPYRKRRLPLQTAKYDGE